MAGRLLLWLFLLLPVSGFTAEWVTLTDCRYVDNPSNDGDSFHVRQGDREFIFRLYWVDCPETDRQFPKRVEEQAKHFGASTNEMLRYGRDAALAVRELLRGQPLEITTRWQNARGRSKLKRHYAFVRYGGGVDLATELVTRGLARLHGVKAADPKGMPAEWIEERLVSLERNAKEKKRGAWRETSETVKEPPSATTPRP